MLWRGAIAMDRIYRNAIESWIDTENGVPYISFIYNGEHYQTNLRGKHQAFNMAHIVRDMKSAGKSREEIDDVLLNQDITGKFETISKNPTVIFDTVQSNEDAKNFMTAVDDYFGRSMQRSAARAKGELHSTTFKKLVIADVFYPELTRTVRQNLTIIFTSKELEDQFKNAGASKVTKTMVMQDIRQALVFARKNFPTHKVFVIGCQNLRKEL